jgi:hypothetical protein
MLDILQKRVEFKFPNLFKKKSVIKKEEDKPKLAEPIENQSEDPFSLAKKRTKFK